MMPSRRQQQLDAEIARAGDTLEADLLRAERIGLLAREGRLAEARRALVPLRERHARRPDAASAAALALADALIDYFSDLSGHARHKLQQARVLSASAGRSRLEALCAAWLAHLDFMHNDSAAMARHIALALERAAPNHHAARARAAMVAALGYHHAARFDLAQPWYECARQHASAEGDVVTIGALMHNMAAYRASLVRQAAVTDGEVPADDAAFALGSAQAAGYFEDSIGGGALSLLNALLRAQLFVIQGRPREALALYESQFDALQIEGLTRVTCCQHADMAWCRAQLQQPEAARTQAEAALAALREDCDVDDQAFTHGRLAQVQRALGDDEAAERHARQADALWQAHRVAQHEAVRCLDEALAGCRPDPVALPIR